MTWVALSSASIWTPMIIRPALWLVSFLGEGEWGKAPSQGVWVEAGKG